MQPKNPARNKHVAIISTLSLLISGVALYSPSAEVALAATTISLESVQNSKVTLGSLASRTQRKALVKSGAAAPYTYTGTDSTTNETYQYRSDRNYTSAANLREADERTPSNAGGNLSSYTSATNQSFQSKTGVLRMANSGNVVGTPTGGTSTNTKDGFQTYGSAFGPQVYSVPFWANTAQSVNFSWWASGSGDEYEIYAYLVKLSGVASGDCSSAAQSSNYGTTADHSILAYGRGKTSTAWTQASNSIPEEACYRVRFVHGTYDASGGLAVGATFYVADFELGLGQVLDFTQPADYIRSSSNQTFTATVTSNAAGASIVLASTTTSVCTVSGLTVTILAGKTGSCTLRADSAAVGAYGSAASVFRTLTVRTAATAPVNNGGNLVTGTRTVCNTLTASLGEWGDGGAAITSTSYQWTRNGVDIAGATSATYVPTNADSGKTITYKVTRTNSVGSTTATATGVTVQDLSLTSIAFSSGGTLTPSFDSCTFAYSTTVTDDSITITPTLASAGQTLQVSGSSVISGQPSQFLSLDSGVNTVSIVVSNGALSQTTTLTITLSEGPVASILAPDTLSATTATIQGFGIANTSDTLNVTFVYSTNPDLSSPTSIVASPGTLTGTNQTLLSADLTGLTAGVTYFYALVVGTTQSTTYSFTTPNAPIVATATASDVARNAATLSASINDNTFATSVYFQIATSSGVISSSPLITLLVDGSITGAIDVSVSASVSGLLPGTTYYFRAVGTNSVGTNYGSILSFTTLPDAPVVTASPATNIAATSAVLPGSVNAQGSNTTQIVLKYSVNSDLSSPTTVTPTPSAAFGNIERLLEYRLSGLTQNITYYYRYEATNAEGTGLSSIVSFTTVPAPEITVTAPGSVSSSNTVTVTVAFSEAVDGLSTSDVVFSGDTTGWTLGDVSGSGANYTFDITPDPLLVNAGSIAISFADGIAEATGGSSGRFNLASSITTIVVELGISAPQIAYSASTYSYRVGDVIGIGNPTSTGGNWATIAVSPSVSAGITFNSSTGAFGGTATAVLSALVFTVTATNPAGTATASFTVIIDPALAAAGEPRVPSYTGPNPTLFVPRVIQEETEITVRVQGERLAQVTAMSHRGVRLSFRIISNELIEVTLPKMTVGIKEIRFDYRGGGIVSYLNAIEIVPKAISEEAKDAQSESSEIIIPESSSPEARPISTLSIFGFVPGTTKLTAAGWKQYAAARATLRASAKEISCVGYTMGPTVLPRDIRLSYNRANYLCTLFKKAVPNLNVVRLEGRQDLRVGNSIRRVEIEWR